jgi:hypothetical protein
MDVWVNSLIKGQREIVQLVRIYLEKQKAKHLARNEGREITEFEIGSYVLVEHVQSNLRRGHKSKLLPFLKGPMKVMAKRGDCHTLRNLITRRDKDYNA